MEDQEMVGGGEVEEFENATTDPILHMYKTFVSLVKIIQIYSEAIAFDKSLKRALKCIDNNSNSSSTSQLGDTAQA